MDFNEIWKRFELPFLLLKWQHNFLNFIAKFGPKAENFHWPNIKARPRKNLDDEKWLQKFEEAINVSTINFLLLPNVHLINFIQESVTCVTAELHRYNTFTFIF